MRLSVVGERGAETVIPAERLEIEGVDLDAVPICESWGVCERQAVWILKKCCSCPVLFCEPCRVEHWHIIQECDAAGGASEVLCKACGKTTYVDPWLPLYPQLIIAGPFPL